MIDHLNRPSGEDFGSCAAANIDDRIAELQAQLAALRRIRRKSSGIVAEHPEQYPYWMPMPKLPTMADMEAKTDQTDNHNRRKLAQSG